MCEPRWRHYDEAQWISNKKTPHPNRNAPFLDLEPGPSIERLNIIFNTGDNFVPNQDEIHFGAIFCVFVLFNKIFLSTQSISWQVDCDWAVGPWFDHSRV